MVLGEDARREPAAQVVEQARTPWVRRPVYAGAPRRAPRQL